MLATYACQNINSVVNTLAVTDEPSGKLLEHCTYLVGDSRPAADLLFSLPDLRWKHRPLSRVRVLGKSLLIFIIILILLIIINPVFFFSLRAALLTV
jgi:hypothetical protein